MRSLSYSLIFAFIATASLLYQHLADLIYEFIANGAPHIHLAAQIVSRHRILIIVDTSHNIYREVMNTRMRKCGVK